jgi:hypothetical protein
MGVTAERMRRPRDTGVKLPDDAAPAVAAWIAAVPSAVVVLLAILLVGPPLGTLLADSSQPRIWPELRWAVQPEPTEQARYLVALTAPLVLAGSTAWLTARHGALLRRPTAHRWALVVQVLAGLALVACLVLQRTTTLGLHYAHSSRVVYFTGATLAVALALAIGTLAVVRRPTAVQWLARWTRESPKRALAATLVAIALTAVTVLPALVTEASILSAEDDVIYHLRFTYDEVLAVLDGRSPLGDFVTQYASLWPYVVAVPLALVGATVGAFTTAMAALTAVTMLALFALLRRVTRSALLALALFLPLLATSAFRLHGPSVGRFSLINYYGTMPLRYAGPFLLAWLLARHLDGAWPRRPWPLLLAALLVAINNVDFGVPAFGATIAALLWALPPTQPRLRALARELAVAGALAVAVVTALVLLRTGELPDWLLPVRHAQLYAVAGYGMGRIDPQLGLSTIIYLTYVAAIGAATVLALRHPRERLLAGLLAWSGVFGLGSGSYYVGRSIAETLTNLFPAWALAVTLLTVFVGRGLIARGGRAPRPMELACLFAFGLLVCSLAQTPSPVAQTRRIAGDGPAFFAHPPSEPFVAAHVRPGEPVAILAEVGHKMALNLGINNVSPYSSNESIATAEELEDVIVALRAAGGTKVFVATRLTPPAVRAALAGHGFELSAASVQDAAELWTQPRRAAG